MKARDFGVGDCFDVGDGCFDTRWIVRIELGLITSFSNALSPSPAFSRMRAISSDKAAIRPSAHVVTGIINLPPALRTGSPFPPEPTANPEILSTKTWKAITFATGWESSWVR
ncbi:hypothetical protein [Caballeronia sordidicola]|uniref:hypothetical protein n=1 Tax=Caballeronia sordidicola TaxID=196367 RepID=UPI0012FE5728|nr:hypothetical protein [Caballeronia sordidicola]